MKTGIILGITLQALLLFVGLHVQQDMSEEIEKKAHLKNVHQLGQTVRTCLLEKGIYPNAGEYIEVSLATLQDNNRLTSLINPSSLNAEYDPDETKVFVFNSTKKSRPEKIDMYVKLVGKESHVAYVDQTVCMDPSCLKMHSLKSTHIDLNYI
jgi:hypothetical protein